MSKDKVCLTAENLTFNKPINQANQKINQNGYALSSWNYGSFHYSNPRYVKKEQVPIKVIGSEAEKINNNNNTNTNNTNYMNINASKPKTSDFNKYGKRKLTETEKIVTEDYLKAMNDIKNIKGTRKLSQTRSSSNLHRHSGKESSYASINILFIISI